MKAFCLALSRSSLLERLACHLLASGLGQAYAALRVLRLLRKAAPLALAQQGMELWLLLDPLAIGAVAFIVWRIASPGMREGLTIARLRPTSGWSCAFSARWQPIAARGPCRG